MPALPAVRISKSALQQILAHARASPLIECCGLLAGRRQIISAVFQATNALASPDPNGHAAATAYQIAPAELFALFRRIRRQNLRLLGIYHSHPTTDNVPSAADIDQAYYPEAAYFILSPQPGAPRPVRAFRIADGRSVELQIQLV